MFEVPKAREELTALEGQINTIIEALFSGVRALSAGVNTDSVSTTATNQSTSSAQSCTNSPDVSVSNHIQ